MKELTIEEKAKRYDEALQKAKRIIDVCVDDNTECRSMIACIQQIFPELKESEDERIRKEIIDILDSYDVAHLKAAGLSSRIPEYIAWLKKQCEHANFRNKIQIGDKVTRNEDGVLVNLSQLNRVAKKDEKQGEQPKKHDVCDYCDQQGSCASPCPMKLVEKQGEQKPSWSEEDERMFFSVIWHLRNSVNNGDRSNPAGKLEPWIRTLKDRVQPHTKQEWSKEDENMLESLTDVLKKYFSGEYGKECIDWLESFKERCTWKPSDEQMDALHYVTNFDYGGHKATLVSLYEQLKKLKG